MEAKPGGCLSVRGSQCHRLPCSYASQGWVWVLGLYVPGSHRYSPFMDFSRIFNVCSSIWGMVCLRFLVKWCQQD